MDVGLIFDVKDPDDLSEFITEEIIKCDEVHHTKTVILMKPVFFPIPKKKPENICRFVIRIYTHPTEYKNVYESLLDYRYPFNMFPIYVSYSLGDEDIIMSIAADSEQTVDRFLKKHIRSHNGVNQAMYYPVHKAKRFAPLAKMIEEQKLHTDKKAWKKSQDEVDLDYDWVENFDEYAQITGALPGDY